MSKAVRHHLALRCKAGIVFAMSANTPPEPRPSMLGMLDRVLRGGFTQREVLAGGRIEVPVAGLVRLSLLLGAGYGISLGCYSLFGGAPQAWLQMLASALKVPLLFLLTLVVSFPSLYVFAALQRLPLDFRNTLKLMLLAIVVHLTVIASLGPVFAFFAASTTSYPFLLLLNVAVFAIGGLLGLMVLRRATRDIFTPPSAAKTTAPVAPPAAVANPETTPETSPETPATPAATPWPATVTTARISHQGAEQARRLMGVWCCVYGVVGAQMGWLLRPFLGSPDAPFEWFRQRDGNFLVAVLSTIGKLFHP
ncbi:MAG: hypothetical protein IT456_14845 [Planctomycetes bacterium]|nr:hypothetical protein [Planctomycetota bacterium]